MKNFILILVLLFSLNSCNKKEKKIKINERILDFSISTYLSSDNMHKLNSGLYENIGSQKFYSETDTIIYKKNEIYISYLTFTNGCANYIGDINIKKDSLFLNLINTRDYVCTEEGIDRIKFRIKNTENKKYKIVKW